MTKSAYLQLIVVTIIFEVFFFLRVLGVDGNFFYLLTSFESIYIISLLKGYIYIFIAFSAMFIIRTSYNGHSHSKKCFPLESFIKYSDSPMRSMEGRSISVIYEIHIILLVAQLISIRFLFFPYPQGFDTLGYVYFAEDILYKGRIFRDCMHFLITILALFLFIITKNNIILTGILLVYVVSILSIMINLKALKILFGSDKVAWIVNLFYVFSWSFIRLSYDLLGQLMGSSIVLFLLALISKEKRLHYDLRIKEVTRTYFNEFLIGLVILPLIHLVTFFILLGFLLAYLLSDYRLLIEYINTFFRFIKKAKTGSSCKKKIIALLPIAFFLVIFFFNATSTFANKIIISLIKNKNVHFFMPFPEWYKILVSEESFFLFILAFFSLVCIRNILRKHNLRLIIYWISYITLLILITGYVESYRLLLYQPLYILSGYGYYIMGNVSWEKRKNIYEENRRSNKRYSFVRRTFPKQVSVLRIFLLTLIIINSINHAYRPSWKFFDYKIYKRLLIAREILGYGNDSVLVVIHPEYYVFHYDNNRAWRLSVYLALSVIGGNIYFGHIDELLAGKPDRFTGYYHDLEHVQYIALISGLFNPQIEAKYLKNVKLVEGNVYMIPLSLIQS